LPEGSATFCRGEWFRPGREQTYHGRLAPMGARGGGWTFQGMQARIAYQGRVPRNQTMSKVAILGSTGKVGSFTAHTISEIPFVHKIVLFGREGREETLEGEKSDLLDSFAARGTNVSVVTSTNPKDLKGSDIIILTAGIPRQDGQDRIDLALENAKMVAGMSKMVGSVAPDSIFLIVTNPVDVMTAVALRYSGMEARKVFGLGTHLDSMRLKAKISEYFEVNVSEIHTRIIGEHGKSMVPLWSATTIGGIQISNLPKFSRLPVDEMIDSVIHGGSSIIRAKGSTIYGPGEAIATLVRTVLGNENRLLTVSSYIRSEVHDIGDVCIGVPARINNRGAFPITIRIHEDEITRFRESVEKIRKITEDVMNYLEKNL